MDKVDVLDTKAKTIVKTINLKVGNDTGNSEHDIVISDSSGSDIEQICQPSVISKVRKKPNLESIDEKYMIENISDNLIVEVLSDEVSPGIFFVGNYALKSGERIKSIEIGLDNDKANNDVVFISTLAHIAGFAVKKAYKEGILDDEINVNIEMGCSLPIGQYNNKVAALFENRFMNDKSIVKVVTPKKSIEVKLNFDFVHAIPEGVTASFALSEMDDSIFKSYNDVNEEKLNKEYFKTHRVLHISIGEGTTEYPITKGIAYEPNYIRGSNNGLGIAIDNSLDEFIELKGMTNCSRQKFSEIIRDKKHRYYEDALEILEFHLDPQTDAIYNKAKTELERVNNEIDIIVVYGGGSILMKNILERRLKRLCERAGIKLLYIDEKYAVTLESKGLYNLVNSALWQVLKNDRLASLNK